MLSTPSHLNQRKQTSHPRATHQWLHTHTHTNHSGDLQFRQPPLGRGRVLSKQFFFLRSESGAITGPGEGEGRQEDGRGREEKRKEGKIGSYFPSRESNKAGRRTTQGGRVSLLDGLLVCLLVVQAVVDLAVVRFLRPMRGPCHTGGLSSESQVCR